MEKRIEADSRDEVAKLRERVSQLMVLLNSAETRLKENRIKDTITELYSHHYFLGRMAEEIERTDRFNAEMACVMIGVRPINESALKDVARCLKRACRQYDIPARWSYGELVILLPSTDSGDAKAWSERFLGQLRGVPGLKGVTVALGFATYPRKDVIDGNAMLELAAAELHQKLDTQQ